MPLIVLINTGDTAKIPSFMTSDVKTPELVWNSQCTIELTQWAAETF